MVEAIIFVILTNNADVTHPYTHSFALNAGTHRTAKECQAQLDQDADKRLAWQRDQDRKDPGEAANVWSVYGKGCFDTLMSQQVVDRFQ